MSNPIASGRRAPTISADKDAPSDSNGGKDPTESGASSNHVREESQLKEPSRWRTLWDKTGLNTPTLMMMAKASISPTIALSFYQADAVATTFTTLGYLVAIASLLAVPIMPRSKFFQTLVFNIVSICIASAIAMLAMWSSVQARIHTSALGVTTGYNSSQSAVCAIWLFSEIYLINALRSARAQLLFPGILTSIFAVVSMSYAPNFGTVALAESFVKRLLGAFLTGFAIATGVNLFVFPVSSRTVIFKEFNGYVGALQGLLKAEIAYIQSVESHDMFRETLPEAAAVRVAVAGLKALHGKVSQDMMFAKREIAWGKLRAKDLSEISQLLRQTLLPFIGMASVIDILRRIGDRQGLNSISIEAMSDDQRRAVKEWQILMKTLHKPFDDARIMIGEGFEHVLLTLELKEAPKKAKGDMNASSDVEAKGDIIGPGDEKFQGYMEDKIRAFYASRQVTLEQWCQQRGIRTPSSSYYAHVDLENELDQEGTGPRQRNQRQLFILLYIEWLLYNSCRSVLDLVKFADSKVADGTLRKKRIILPGKRRFYKWVMNSLNSGQHASEDHFDGVDQSQAADTDTYVGEAFRGKKDSEHLPPVNNWEKLGNVLRAVPRGLRSPHSIFGFRVACAVMTINIVAYLEATYEFYLVQRLFWAAIMVSISMNRLSGQSTFNFILRVFGTFMAMVASYVIYYMVDGHTPGVLVFEFIWVACAFYIVIKKPKYTVVGMISGITSILILGYELQVKKIGVVLSESNYQAYYPLYELAPYRLACVVGGIFVAWIWTIFPFPISEHSEIRRDLGRSLHLLAMHHEIVRVTVRTRLQGEEGDPNSKTSPGYRLTKARLDVFAKLAVLMEGLKANSNFHRFNLSLGGKFPEEKYNACIALVENISNYGSLLSYAAKSFNSELETMHQWQIDLMKLIDSVQSRSHDVTTRLCLLANSVSQGMPLPPFLEPFEPYMLVKRLEALDRDILGVEHISEPGFSAFAVIQVAARSLTLDLNELTDNVRDLVGELDFSIRSSSGHNMSEEDVPSGSRKLD